MRDIDTECADALQLLINDYAVNDGTSHNPLDVPTFRKYLKDHPKGKVYIAFIDNKGSRCRFYMKTMNIVTLIG